MLIIFKYFLPILFLISCSSDSKITRNLKLVKNIDYDAVHFIIVSHPDDWQLFLGEFAYDLIASEKTKVVFILTDAGDWGRGDSYWYAREQASMASIRSVYNYDIFSPHFDEVDEIKNIFGKDISVTSLKNTSSYFFRLPDGSPKGLGYPSQEHQSLYKLYHGSINEITSVDKKNNFTLRELHEVIQNIIETESAGYSSQRFYLVDSGPKENFEHSDHFTTQEIAWKSISDLNHDFCSIYLFEDYRTKSKSINIANKGDNKKIQLFNAYDLYMLGSNEDCTLCNRVHFEWLFRTYYRVFSCI